MPWTAKTTSPVLTQRIPCWPFGDPKDRRIISFDDYTRTGGYEALRKALETMTPEQVTEEVKKSTLRGRGGAGFPTGLKWTFLPKPDASGEGGPRYLAINADESEPATFKDRLLMDFDPHLVLEGIAIACYACRIQTAYFYIRGEYHHQAVVMERAIAEAYDRGVLGGHGLLGGLRTKNRDLPWKVDVHLHRGAGAYICGEETALLESIEGKRGWPRNKPPFPAIKGLFGRPTIINNVETLAHVPFIIQRGADAFMTQGTQSSLPGAPPSFGTKLMGVSGHVNRPGVYECDLGIPLRVLVESKDYAGGMRHGKRFKGAIAGGISMGVLGPDQLDAEMDFDIGRKYNVLGLGTACPTVFDQDTDMVAVARNVARFFKHESCGQCTPCREGSGWLYQLMTRIESGGAKTKDLDLALEIATSMGTMPGTTICGLADGNNWAVRTIINKFRSEFEARVQRTFVPVGISVGAL
ncbi:MAG: NADH-quinone oxidoreductase subunit NuoF [Planctomyces sp.]|nr:NADH-quinone oxidoreductase subunit NuoF [Planctomyces sp.]MBA4038871.1 NADH-quinone oxidoreductase subunit NuoF [Planctomyces sp.]MBA4119733.1 NADH-quinone oxidoreductase subunit NuoF [Isosphaera sp.]